MAVGLKRDTKENTRLCRIVQLFSELKQLRRLLKENREHYRYLVEFKEMPIALLEELGVDRPTSEAIFTLGGRLTPDFLESFRRTESRKFWE